MQPLTEGQTVLFNGRKWRYDGPADDDKKIKVTLLMPDGNPGKLVSAVPKSSITLPPPPPSGGPVDKQGTDIKTGDILLYQMPEKGRQFALFSVISRVTKTDGMDIYGVDLLKDEGYTATAHRDGPFSDLLNDIYNSYDRKADTSEHKLRPGTEYVVFNESVDGRPAAPPPRRPSPPRRRPFLPVFPTELARYREAAEGVKDGGRRKTRKSKRRHRKTRRSRK